MSDFFSWERFTSAFTQVMQNFPITLQMILYAELIGIVLGVFVAVIRIYKIPVFNQILSVYISFMRGTPVLVQLLVVFYGLPVLTLNLTGMDINGWDKFIFACIALALNESAMLAEIFRSALTSIPVTQWEAGFSIGLTWWQTFHRIILPQAIRIAIPSYGVNLVALIQGTSIAYLIGVIDLMGRARAIGIVTKHNFEPYIAVTLIYVVFSLLVKGFFKLVDQKLKYENIRKVGA